LEKEQSGGQTFLYIKEKYPNETKRSFEIKACPKQVDPKKCLQNDHENQN
jgi:hypothetical protein